MSGIVTYLILAHADAGHVRRLVAAVHPAPVVLHCDGRTDDAVYEGMVAGQDTVIPVRRRPTPWGSWGAVTAELDGLRVALQKTDCDHVVILQGSDYPLQSNGVIERALGDLAGRSVTPMQRLPRAAWSGHGGLDRLRYPHWVVRRHMVRLPVRRRIPSGVVPAGGSVNKILSRRHAELILDLDARRPDLARFWRRTWNPDETYVHSLLATALRSVPGADDVVAENLWFTDWGKLRQRSPEWLTDQHRDDVTRAARGMRPPALFARKFASSPSSPLLDFIDGELRAV
jgi:hypothetical protein